MDINIQWVTQVGTAVTDYFNVLYKEFDLYPPLNGLNNWILATDPPLPPTQFNYTITGLKENTIYRIMVTKSCTGFTEIVDEITFIRTGYPIIGTWQGPVVNSYPTLFYSVYYPEGLHIRNAEVKLYDTETYDRMLMECGAPDPAYVVIGRNGYLTGAICPPIGNSWNYLCDLQTLDYLLPSNTSSAVSYYGRDSSTPLFPLCDGTASMPLLLKYNNDYKLYSKAIQRFATTFSSIDPASSESAVNWPAFTFPSNPAQPYPNLNSANVANLSSAICFDPLTATADYTFADGTGRTNIANYLFSFTTSDGVNTIPYVDNNGNLITSSNGSYTIYAPIKIQSTAPGGGNPSGYTITNALSSGTNTTYTYTGATNAFTVGQEVFVGNINPNGFNFSSIPGPTQFASRTITAATSNSFTVSFNTSAAGAYQTGGIVTGYTEITDNMTITVDLLPGPVNVITLTNQNYAGLTLIQALNQVAGAINAAGTYTASAVVIAGLPYLRINMPDITYGLASVKFEGPNILKKGNLDIYQISSAGAALSTASSFNYNGFLYAAFYEAAAARIVVSDINNPTVATSYNHDIDVPVIDIALVPEAPPTTVYSLDRVTSGGEYSLNIAIDTTTGYSYTANNTTVSVYDGTIFIDSQDLSLLPLGPTTPIRLMEFNTTDNTLFVFVDGSSNNFYIVDVAPWSIITSGTYGQTNYLKRSTITAWNNLPSGSPFTAMGRINVDPSSPSTVPIPCATAPCPVLPAVWQIGRNDGVISALFQDTTQSWGIVPPTTNLYYGSEFNVYNYNTQQLGVMMAYNGALYNSFPGISGNTIAISAAKSSTLPLTYSAFNATLNDDFGLFHYFRIVDYTASFTSRSWENTARYLIEGGRNQGSNGFFNTASITSTQIIPDDYSRNFRTGDKKINTTIALDGTSEYLLYEINDGGTTYESSGNFVYVSLDGGLVQAIDGLGTVYNIQLYKDYPLTTDPVQVPLQLVTDTTSGYVYGIARDARSAVDDMNVYIIQGNFQYGVIDGASKWNIPICGQIAVDSDTGDLYFTGKNTRKLISVQYPTGSQNWGMQDIPSVYEKLNGFTYGDGSIIERVQGASLIQGLTSGTIKLVMMNYLQQTFSTQLKYTYEVANLFVYDFGTSTIEQVIIGTGVSSYSGAPASYNPNYYGEGFGINDYNNDYCYGGLSIKTNPINRQIFWKKSISDQVYFSEPHTETGVAQIWGTSAQVGLCGNLIRIWNIQSDGSLIPSKRTILDMYSILTNVTYDSYYEKVLTIPSTQSNVNSQFYLINPKTLGGVHGVNNIGPSSKSNTGLTMNGLAPTTWSNGKETNVYAVVVTPSDITYYVRPVGASINGYFPHHYTVGQLVQISGIVSSPIDELNFPNPDTPPNGYATILSVTPVTFTVANTYGATATYTSGGLVKDAEWVNVTFSGGFGKLVTKNDGTIVGLGQIYFNQGSAGINGAYSTFMLEFGPNDLLTQRENPSINPLGLTSTICSATPDGLFTDFRASGQLLNSLLIYVPSQNTYWVLGTKNPTCSVSNITNAVYNAGAQTVRYTINNNFLVGKVVNISGVTPTTYNLTGVTIIAADPTGFEISYTGANPGTFIPPTPPAITGVVQLTPSYVLKVLNANTFATVATIDLGFLNDFIRLYVINFINTGRFQYSEATEEIYLYTSDPTIPVYVFSTITNSLVRSSSFARMVLPYVLNTNDKIYTIEDVNGVPYFSVYSSLATLTPTRFWFRLDLGDRTYLNAAHGQFDTIVTDAVTSYTFNNDFYGGYGSAGNTFGQWKDILDTTWATIPTSITTTLNSTIEFVSFKMDSPILSIENNTTGYLYPVSNTLNYVPVYSILIDNVNISDSDSLNFTFANPDNPSCPFTRQVIIYF
jgi:hypothetical protein